MNRLHKLSVIQHRLGFDRLASVVAISIGILVIIGWTFNAEVLKRMVPTLVAMNPVTAICFILLGVSVWASHSEVPSRVEIAVVRCSAFVVLMVSGLKLCEVTLGLSSGIDQVFFHEKLSWDASFPPNRIAPNTAFNLALLSVSLLLPWRKGCSRFHISTGLILLSIISSLLPVVGYLYGTKPLYGVGQFIPMALHTALTFLVLSVGILLGRPERPIVATLFDSGMSGVMVRRLLPAVIGLPIALSWLRLRGQQLGYYDNELGAALMAVTQFSLLGVIVWWNSFLLLSLDKERKSAEAKLGELVLTDDLTGLRNRRGFTLLAEQQLKLAKNRQMGIVLWCIYADLDGLKKINDTLGHDAGSQAIVHSAAILKSTFRESDIIARLGGDEFAILAATNTVTEGHVLVDRLHSNVNEFNEHANLPYRISISLGIVPIDAPEQATLEEVVKNADTKMYMDKQARKSQVNAASLTFATTKAPQLA